MKRVLLLLSVLFVLSVNESYGQLTVAPKLESNKVETTALEPANKVAYVFSSEEDKAAAVSKKVASIKEEILSGRYNAEEVKQMRENIWRLENAVVREQ